MIPNIQAREAVCAHHCGTSESVTVACSVCTKTKKVKCSHAMSDTAIAKRHFPRWTIKGVYGAKRTRCPNCFNK